MTTRTVFLMMLCLASLNLAASERESRYAGDKDDPASVSSFVGLRTGTNGYGAVFQLGVNDVESAFGHNSLLQFKDDFDTVHLRHLSLYKGSGTGVFIDAQHDNSGMFDINRASVGVLQVIPVTESLRISPAILYGQTWTSDDRIKRLAFPDTDIATLYAFTRWQIRSDWFVNLIPQYTYSTNGRKIRLFEMVTQLGHNITEDTSIAVNADEDDQIWLTVKQAF